MSVQDSNVVIGSQAEVSTSPTTGLFALASLTFGHFTVDLYSSALGALQPLLASKFSLSLTRAGILSSVLILSASVAQPVYGYLSDRFHSRAFTVLAPAVAAVFISGIGWAPSYPWLLMLVLLGGVGVASFHPQGSAWAVREAGRQPGQAMALFITGGALGYALGPTYFSAILGRWGLDYLYWGALPGVAGTFLLLQLKPDYVSRRRATKSFDWRPLAAVWKPLLLLYLAVFLRSILQIAFAQFLPLYLHRERGFSIASAGYALSAFLAAGAAGGFLGGRLADRFGGRKIILFSMGASVPFFVLFFLNTGWVAITSLVLGGFILLFTIPVNVVMAQQLAPSQAATVSALLMGFAWGMAGLVFVPLIGLVADALSLHAALASLTIFPLIGFFLALKLPK